MALPPTLAGRIDYEPSLPARRDQLVQHMPQGSVIKFHVLYDEPWWRAEGLSGLVLCPHEPIGVTFDCTPPAGTPGLISGFFEGPDAVAHGERTSDERREVVVDVLARTLGERARDVLDYVDLDWSAEPFTRGCYGAHLPPGAWTVYGPALREPVGRIHWAGHRDGRALDRLHRRCHRFGPAGGRRGARRPRGLTAALPCATPSASGAPSGMLFAKSSDRPVDEAQVLERWFGTPEAAGGSAGRPCGPPTWRYPTRGRSACSARARRGCGGSSTG